MEKIVLYPRVNVYQNAIPLHKSHINLLKKSESQKSQHLFIDWEDWYGFGDMMNLDMDPSGQYISKNGKQIDLNDEYAKEQIAFLKDLHRVFQEVTMDYIREYAILLPNWHFSGFSVCKYNETAEENKLAMHYHTDYVGATADDPGKKFAITCTMYLNDDYEGGGLSFLEEESGDVIDYKPKAGDVVVFPSGDPITGASRYFHGVDRISNGDKYLVRTFWMYDYPGSEYWHEGNAKHGEEKWKEIRKSEMKESFNSGQWHRYVVFSNEDDKKIQGSTPFFFKGTKIGNSNHFIKGSK